MRNDSLQFRCQDVHLRVETTATPFTARCTRGDVVRVPISHGEGSYYADAETLDELEAGGRVAFRYCTADGEITPEANPNGSLRNIAGIVNARGNVLGMMPHPERASEALLGGETAWSSGAASSRRPWRWPPASLRSACRSLLHRELRPGDTLINSAAVTSRPWYKRWQSPGRSLADIAIFSVYGLIPMWHFFAPRTERSKWVVTIAYLGVSF